ncbi:aminomethyl transferase family protein [Novosphingobium resinovorum]|uniref:aminomethyl transferase family protein n=1 Tax=Novosphingobium resinovorum TaxID=158500 RepID=UPI002ED014B8|nr:aminomethyl transferase family protein [Novosphingobium resinovorum]
MNAPLAESLEMAIRRAGSAVDLLRDSQRRAFSHGTVSGQFTNWQSEVNSWLTSVGFMDQSHHMVDHYVKGPDAFKLLRHLAVNSFENFRPGMAKQFVATTPEGYYLGDCVLFYLEENLFNLVGRPTALDWVQYHVETGDWNVTTERDPQSMDRGGRPPVVYRYEVQGPLAGALMEKVTGKPLPEIRFFGMTDFQIAGHRVAALRHGMAGAIGFEIFGPWSQGEAVRDAILAAGEEFGLVKVGSIAYSTANLESGWVPGPMPAIFSAESLKAYREWLPAKAAGSLAGSFNSANIEDYYVTPFDLGYDRIVKFDHDFVGSDALQERIKSNRRKKVTLVWDADDMARVVSSAWRDGPKYKHFNMPKARYGLYQMDEVLIGGQRAGISLDCGYLANERKIVSLAVIDEAFAATGTEVSVLWGENPVSKKPQVEPHEQTAIKATVAPAPYGAHARTTYRK